MPSHRQKKLEKKKKQRLAARTATRAATTPSSLNGVLRLAAQAPFGQAFMSPEWRSAEPDLVSVVLTRQLENGSIVAGMALVDRTCLGVKNAFARQLHSKEELAELIELVGEAHESELEEVSVLEAQSVVYNAIDYARSVGFEPDRDFPEPVFGPRPETLLETPLARSERPLYVPGPSDDVARIVRIVEAKGGQLAGL